MAAGRRRNVDDENVAGDFNDSRDNPGRITDDWLQSSDPSRRDESAPTREFADYAGALGKAKGDEEEAYEEGEEYNDSPDSVNAVTAAQRGAMGAEEERALRHLGTGLGDDDHAEVRDALSSTEFRHFGPSKATYIYSHS